MKTRKTMMKVTKLLLLCSMMMAMLAACGQEASEEMVQEISLSQDKARVAKEPEETAEEESEAEEASAAGAEDSGGVFAFTYEGVRLVPGEAFDASALPEYDSVAKVPSCALAGTDNAYDYGGKIEVVAYDEGNGEHIYSVYLADPNLTTAEGLSQGSTVSDMVALYGEDYEIEDNSYTYTRGNTLLSVITQDDTVISIEYRLDLE